jgi:hypothetical protein
VATGVNVAALSQKYKKLQRETVVRGIRAYLYTLNLYHR